MVQYVATVFATDERSVAFLAQKTRTPAGPWRLNPSSTPEAMEVSRAKRSATAAISRARTTKLRCMRWPYHISAPRKKPT